MSLTAKLTIASTMTGAAAAGLGLFAAKSMDGASRELVAVGVITIAAAAAALLGFVIGRSIARQLGEEPGELRRRVDELGSGFLNYSWADERRGDEDESAGARLAETIDQLSAVFRTVNRTARATLEASYRVRAAACLGFPEETRLQTLKATDELLAHAKALNQSIDYYSFERDEMRQSRASGFESPAPALEIPTEARSSGVRLLAQATVERPSLRLLSPEEQGAGARSPSWRPILWPKPKLVLLRTPRKEA